MGWSWRVGRVAGIDLYVHFTFLILLGWVVIGHWLAHQDVVEALVGLAFVLTLFGIVVLHELGHALAARRYGIPTRDITLLPIGGVARLERMPEKPTQELVVALAGPAVNVALAILLFVILAVGAAITPVDDAARVGGNFLSQLFWINVVLAVFNMLPAFPMDGGRVLRALLALRLDYVRATRIAAAIGQAMAILFFFLGLLFNPFLMFIALFVWLGAAQEASMVQMRSVLDGIPVRRAMVSHFQALRPQDSLTRAVELLVGGFQQDFPVLDAEGRLVGMLARADLPASLQRYGPEGLVGDVMRRDFVTTEPNEMLQSALGRLQGNEPHTLPVVHDGRLEGLLTSENLAEVLMIEEALRAAHDDGHGPSHVDRFASPRQQPVDDSHRTSA